ncbi:peroxisomal N(1)-acetyl-spermine/spermidine oxidase-like [Protopterus annectens]|uniref:peroxisomal N(1)-acetyl-spermine/spermidine oxidase-like n=1 Tax=Protopterus annectens TaxID=7888 RepID=UPI001CFB1A9A|nr:peroxisomal N(1)-acetyl-spermine/spermidine oxidase-like [Protopterus annectens]XP_043912874.1 peroxisomal N(1)-acetyl-spermine/spermidine oxidase-like [Protopterus annectens]
MAMTESASLPRIVIIGCGIAGIGAAQCLFSHGYRDLKVVEATARPGGRIKTTKFGKGLVEIGANWIHGPSKQNPVFQLACQHGLLDAEALSEKNQAIKLGGHLAHLPVSYSSSGKVISPVVNETIRQFYINVLEKAKEAFSAGKEPCASFGEFVKVEALEAMQTWKDDADSPQLHLAVLNAMMKHECCTNGTHSMDLVGFSGYGEYETLPGLDCTFPRGYEGIIDSLMTSLPKGIFTFNKPVRCIHWQSTSPGSNSSGQRTFPVLVELKNGETLLADHVIVTVPLGYLKEHYRTFFHPPLPSTKAKSIEKMGFGINNKIFMEFEKPFWEPDCQRIHLVWEDESPFDDVRLNLQKNWFKKLARITVLHPSERYGHVLCGWIAGYEGEYMETLSDAEVLNTMTQLIRRFTGNHPCATPKRILRTRWNSDPYTKGCYSYTGIGCTGDDIDSLAEPLPSSQEWKDKPLQVLFAGEATHRNFYSTTHGALLSGRREADRIIKFYTPDSLRSKSKL